MRIIFSIVISLANDHNIIYVDDDNTNGRWDSSK